MVGFGELNLGWATGNLVALLDSESQTDRWTDRQPHQLAKNAWAGGLAVFGSSSLVISRVLITTKIICEEECAVLN